MTKSTVIAGLILSSFALGQADARPITRPTIPESLKVYSCEAELTVTNGTTSSSSQTKSFVVLIEKRGSFFPRDVRITLAEEIGPTKNMIEHKFFADEQRVRAENGVPVTEYTTTLRSIDFTFRTSSTKAGEYNAGFSFFRAGTFRTEIETDEDGSGCKLLYTR